MTPDWNVCTSGTPVRLEQRPVSQWSGLPALTPMTQEDAAVDEVGEALMVVPNAPDSVDQLLRARRSAARAVAPGRRTAGRRLPTEGLRSPAVAASARRNSATLRHRW